MRFVLTGLISLWGVCGYADKGLEEWFGNWEGTCFPSVGPNGEAPTNYGMKKSIVLKSRGLYDLTIQYDGEPMRRYEMKATPDTGHFVVDEKNGILIDEFFVNGELTDMYSINGKVFSTLTRVDGNEMNVIVKSFWADPIRRTSMPNGSNEVASFAVRDVTHCALVRHEAPSATTDLR